MNGNNKGLWIAVITGILAIAGTAAGALFQGMAEVSLEKTRLDSKLILNALASNSLQARRASLRFLVVTNLINDEDTRDGLRRYFEGDNPTDPPQWSPLSSAESRTLTARTAHNASKTDVDFFLCGRDKNNRTLHLASVQAAEALRTAGGFGESKFKVWDGGLYRELPLRTLQGYTTVVLDMQHPEAEERERLQQILSGVDGLPPVQFVANRGEESAWRVSVIVCAPAA